MAKDKTLLIILAIGALLVLGGVVTIPNLSQAAPPPEEGSEPGAPLYIDDNQGDAATLYIDTYTGEWGAQGAKTEILPVYTLEGDDGDVPVNDVEANSTTRVVVGDSGTAFCTGATYYCDPEDYDVGGEVDSVELKGYTAVATTDLVITAYDEDGTTALTADDGTNNTADYAGGNRAADEEYTYYIKLKVNTANKAFMLGAIATSACGAEIDDFTLEENGWKEVACPKALSGAAVAQYDDGNESTTCSWDNCYVPTSDADGAVCNYGGCYIPMFEFDSIKYQFVLDTDDSTQPSANGDSYAAVGFVDSGFEKDKDNNDETARLWYQGTTEDPAGVGIDESVDTTMTGLDVAVTIEPQ